MKQLTPREKEVLTLVSNGETSKGIAKLLGITPRTVDAHRSNILRKLNANNLQHAVRLGIELGYIALSDMAVAYILERNKMQNKFLGAIDEHIEWDANKPLYEEVKPINHIELD